MAYKSFENCTKEEYDRVIYSGEGSNNRLIVSGFTNIDDYCEKIEITSRILADDSSKRFSLNNFYAKTCELVLHDINVDNIVNPLSISIGTLVNNVYEDVPIGIFYLQNSPTTDKGKTTIKLRDGSVKLDFNYNAEPLIQEHGGIATKLQIFNDILSKAGIETDIVSFLHCEDEVGVYDNSITARQYISYLAEQAGCIPTIDRLGKLIFININDLETQRIPLSVIEKYENGKIYEISKTIYESGIIKYEDGTNTKDILFIDASNPYIITQQHLEDIHNVVNGFKINSLKTGKILGNPALDSYDLIEFEDEGVTYKTLANNKLIYKGIINQEFDTTIGEEERKQNVTNRGDANIKKWAKTQIDNVEAKVDISVGQSNEALQQINSLEVSLNGISSSVSSMTSNLEDLDKKYTELNESITTQTATSIETWFNSSGIQESLSNLQNGLNENSEALLNYSTYIRQAVDTEEASEHYGEAYIELGASDNEVIVRIYPDIIYFLTNGERTAYISNNSLYIIQKQRIGHWETSVDNVGNLNTYWVD